jgi:hypothetical protein
MSRQPGGYIGFNRTPAATAINSAAVGVWTLREAEANRRAGTWPRGLPESDYLNVSLLLLMNGTNNSTTFTDSGPGARAVTANGDAKVSTAQSKFGGASGLFDGTGDFLSVPNNAAFDFGSGDLAIEAWIYIAGNSPADVDGNRGGTICNTWSSAASITGWAFNILGSSTTTGTGLAFDSWNAAAGTLFRATESISQSTWHHVAASVSGGTRRLYLNGSLLTNTTTLTVGAGYTTPNSLGSNLRVGNTAQPSYPLGLNGYIDDLRITKDSARGYTTSTISVPTAELPS